MSAPTTAIVTRYCPRCCEDTPHVALGIESGLKNLSVYTCRTCKRVTRGAAAHHETATDRT